MIFKAQALHWRIPSLFNQMRPCTLAISLFSHQLSLSIRGVPRNQLMMTEMVVNQAFENMGLRSTPTLATFFDGASRHSPEGLWFRERAKDAWTLRLDH